MQYFDPNNAFDAEGLTRLTEQTQKRARERNEIERDTAVAISMKNFETAQQQLSIDRDKRFAELQQGQEVAARQAEQAAMVANVQADKHREAELVRIEAERKIKEFDVAREQAVQQRQIEAGREVEIMKIDQQRAMQLADQGRAIAIAQKSEEQSHAEARANEARAAAVKAAQAVITAEEVATADRDKQVALVLAAQEAEKQAISIRVAALADKDAAESRAEAIRTLAKANRDNYEVEAVGKQLLNQAINTLSDVQVSLQAKLALISALPRIIEESVKPMQKIEGIRIMQVDGLNAGNSGMGGGADSMTAGGGGNLAEQAVGAALRYRAYAPVVDQLIKEVGLSDRGLAGLVPGAAGQAAAQVSSLNAS
jgi:uncharacterized membrane protein YqiK